jgi:hypothetical protein
MYGNWLRLKIHNFVGGKQYPQIRKENGHISLQTSWRFVNCKTVVTNKATENHSKDKAGNKNQIIHKTKSQHRVLNAQIWSQETKEDHHHEMRQKKRPTFFFWSCCILPAISRNHHPSEDLWAEGARKVGSCEPDPAGRGQTRLRKTGGAHCCSVPAHTRARKKGEERRARRQRRSPCPGALELKGADKGEGADHPTNEHSCDLRRARGHPHGVGGKRESGS